MSAVPVLPFMSACLRRQLLLAFRRPLEIANPLLTDVNFTYVGGIENGTLTRTTKGTFNKGNEFVVAGKIESGARDVSVQIQAGGAHGVASWRSRSAFAAWRAALAWSPSMRAAAPRLCWSSGSEGSSFAATAR